MPNLVVELEEDDVRSLADLAAENAQSAEDYAQQLLTREIRGTARALALVKKAGENSGLSEDEAMRVALEEVRALRGDESSD